MDLSQQALQINGKLFSNFQFVFELTTIKKKKIIVTLGLCMRGGGGFCAD